MRLRHSLTTPYTLGSLFAVILVGWWCVCILFSGVEPTNPVEWVQWGGGVQRDFISHQPWRLLTACLHHATASHLLINTLLLFTISILTIRFVGHRAIVAIFMLSSWTSTAITATMTSAWLVGASGGIHGLLGLTAHRLTQTGKPRDIAAAAMITGIAIGMGLLEKSSLFSHLIGYAVGVVLSWMIRQPKMEGVLYRLTILALLSAVCLWLLTVSL